MNAMLLQLATPFDPARLHWRVGARSKDKTRGQMLAYIDARDVMNRLDEVCGTGWQCEYLPVHNGIVICRIGIHYDGWIWRSNGAGETDYEAEKGAASDAFKRAAVVWGIGRYLYFLDSPWIQLQNEHAPKGWRPDKLPPWAYPDHKKWKLPGAVPEPTITEDQAMALDAMCNETESDRTAFLKWIGAKSFADIPAPRFDDCVAAFQAKADKMGKAA